jgi:serine/threonine protein kinase/Flp pilus assembly protein TadD
VIKQLKPQISSDDALQMARRCFNTEAQVLYQLGIHDQIPRLLAHFEDNQEFYLAQEFVEGEPLTKEFVEGKTWSENQVVFWLQDILKVLAFVHQRQVIHRDLKPSNLIRRRHDRRIVLIDFGAVKQVSTQGVDLEQGLTNITISIGTQGYMPNEQVAGKPRFSSDIYAVGILGIQALTGIHPRHLGEDLEGEISWHHLAPELHPELTKILDQMVRYDFRERFPTAIETLEALEKVPVAVTDPFILFPPYVGTNGNSIEAGTTANLREFSRPLPDFSSADFTVSEEDLMSTAVWDRSGNEPPETQIQAEGISEAHPTHSSTNGSTHGSTNGTGITQVVSPPPPVVEPIATQSRKATRTWGILGAIAVTLGLGLFMQMAQPQRDTAEPGIFPTALSDPGDPPTDPKKKAALLLDRANNLRLQWKNQEAIKVYDEALAIRSDYAEAYAGRCETLNQLKRPEEAIVSCNDALAFKPNYPEALWSKGNALLQQNRTYEALSIYEGVTADKPKFSEGWVKRGVALQKLGRSSEAINALDEGIRIQRNSAEAWRTKGAALLNLQRYQEATVVLDKALQLKPKDPEAQRLRQEARAALGG